MDGDAPYWLAMSKVAGIGPARMRLLIEQFGDVRSAWDANLTDLLAAGLDARTAASLLNFRRSFDFAAELAQLEAAGVKALTWNDDAYPERLKEVDDAPPVLYLLGEIMPADAWAVGVVGTRRATTYGREVTAKLSAGLAEAGVTVVSGLARGIDTVAHLAALDAGGRTIAVLGSGPDVIYPPENRNLARRIVEEGGGAIISEYPLGTEPDAVNFPPRNRIISGLSLGIVVVEAGDKSGALITVSFALEQNREVFAVPGPITSRMSDGPNTLLKRGAKCVTSVEDILEELDIRMVSEHVEAVRALPSDPTERLLLELLQDSSQHVDELTNKSGLPPSTVSAVLTMMELKGMVRHLGGMQYGAR
ncbi:MAG TPA: DNA-processing protein DprA [Chloroflexia bacterium]|nr:DNA-processing protein DprA [Chloroflexia bacterium]